jgi:prepilin-type N-terminal cleavage/methylation domain-containing protein
MRRHAFTLLELVFVIVIMGILAKYGVELLSQAYKSFIFSSVNNRLQSQTAAAVETIGSRLQYRIKDSVIARKTATDFEALAYSPYEENATILEWVGTDIEGFRGNTPNAGGDFLPHWSGIIDLKDPDTNATNLVSPGTDTGELNTLIGVLSHGSGTTINDAALYFVGSDSDIKTGYGWDGVALTDHNTSVMHPIRSNGSTQFVPVNGADGTNSTFADTNVYEYYQLAWTAYAVVHTPDDGNLTLYYDYQPWQGEMYTSGKSAVIMENVDTFRFKAVGSIVKIQVCVNSDLVKDEEYSLCKEKTIF